MMKTNISTKNIWPILIVFMFGSGLVSLACDLTTVFQPSTPTPTPTSTLTASPTVTPSVTFTETPTLTPTDTPTSPPTQAIPSGTPMARWHNLPIMHDAVAAEGEPDDRVYIYVTHADQDEVLQYYLVQLSRYGWEIDWTSPNDREGYIIYRKNVLDFIYIFEQGDLTFVNMFLSTSSPSLNP